MIDVSNTPASLRVLQQWLVTGDFRELRAEVVDARSGYSEWVDDTRRVELRCDRGDWSLSLRLAPMANAYHPDEWEAWLDRLPLRRHLSPIDHQVEFIVDRWSHAVRRAALDVSRAETELEAIGLDWVERRFGWRPGA